MKMDKQTVFETIEQFLRGKLKGAELKSFQEKLESDQSFANEVNIHRSLENALKHSPEDDLRANLDKLSREYKPKKKWNRLISLLALAFLLGLGGWWFLKDTNTIAEGPSPIDTHQESTTSPEQEATHEEKIEPNPEVQPLESPAIQEEKTTIDTEKTKAPSSLPIAANFEVNPLLEPHIDNFIRGGDYEFEIIEPTRETQIKIEKSEATFHFSGLLKTEKTTLNDDFQIHLFSNKTEDYENFRPIFTLPLNFDQQEDGFKFDVIHHQTLAPGLYYYLLEDANSGEMIRVGKLEIR